MKKLLMGNEAFACAALEAGVGVVAGYPGTPSSELIETIAARVADGSAQGVHVEWSTNEKAALELAAGASYAGARTLFTCKQVGLNVASDALMSLNYVGIEGGCVLYVADDPGPISSQTEQDTRRFAAFAKVPVLDPENIEQGIEMMRAAFNLSERYRTPVILRATTRVCHSSTFVEVADVTHARPAKGFKKDDTRWVIFPRRAAEGHREVNERLKWIEAEFSGTQVSENGEPVRAFVDAGESFGDDECTFMCMGAAAHEGIGTNPADLLPDYLLPAAAVDLHEWAMDGSRRSDALPGSHEGEALANPDSQAESKGAAEDDKERAELIATMEKIRPDERAGMVPAPELTSPCNLARFNPIESGTDACGFAALDAGAEVATTSGDDAERSTSSDASPNAAAHADFSAKTLGIVCGGVSTAYVREALAMIAQDPATEERSRLYGSIPYEFLQVGTPFPFPLERASAFADRVDHIIVFEELDHVLEDEFVRLMGLRAASGLSVVRVEGRRSGACHGVGENTVESAVEVLRCQFDALELEARGFAGDELEDELAVRRIARLDERIDHLKAAPNAKLPVRPPVLCAGCPHRGAFYAAKQAVRAMRVKAVFSGDIGCYTLGNAQPLDAVDTCLCMGAGITMAQGLGTVEPGVKQLAFVGDSTFFASGMTGVANAAYNGHDICVCVLDNSTTAMTGGQPHPGIGRTLMGTMSEPLSIETTLETLGVKCIEHANPHHLQESVDAVAHALEHEGISAVIFRAPCVNLVKPKAPVTIDTEACTGCKKCITSIGCPAIGFDVHGAREVSEGARKRPGVATVDPTLCTGCGLCTQVCPFDCIKATADSKEDAQ
ncbi:thiamine pyrophosphate-dependent enzyme [Slackia equolifaciens]|nr:thiamine pyrophosphate-dependent enzyme [Slackia equolifaciens]